MITSQPRILSRRALFTRGAIDRSRSSDHWLRVHRRLMACRVEITLTGDDSAHLPAARAALDEADRLEAMLSVFRDSSDLVHLNRTAGTAPVAVPAELFEVLCLAAVLHRDTGGAFDVTTTPLSRCWGFLVRNGRLPAAHEIEAARASVGMAAIRLDAVSRTVRFNKPGLEINLNAIGKGYVLDRMAGGLRSGGVRRALLSAGRSSVVAIGGRFRPWTIDLCSPLRSRPLAHVALADGALGTSGAGEQFVEIDGTRYGHVLDPRTGQPATGTLSASVIARNAATADALSTAFFIEGAGLAQRYCAAHADVLAVVTPDEADAQPQVFGSLSGATVTIGRDAA